MPGHTSAPAFEISALLRADPVFSTRCFLHVPLGMRRLLTRCTSVAPFAILQHHCCLIGPSGNSLSLSLSSSLPHQDSFFPTVLFAGPISFKWCLKEEDTFLCLSASGFFGLAYLCLTLLHVCVCQFFLFISEVCSLQCHRYM